MCLPACCCFVEFLPFICLVTIPLYGAFCGVDVILRLSILLLVHSILINYIPKQWVSIVPYSQIILLVILAYLPINIAPWPIVWIYRVILHVTEPVLLWLEIILVQNYIMRCSQRVIDEWDSDEPATRALLIGFSSVCYGISAAFGWSIYTESSSIHIWCLLFVIIVFIMIHNMMVIAPQGILSDAAFCGLCSVFVLYAMIQETNIIQHPISTPPSWNRVEKSSFVQILIYILKLKMEYAVEAIQLLSKFLTPFFLITMAIRLYSILFIMDKVSVNILQDEDEEESTLILEDELLYDISSWRSPLLVKLAVIFMFTQLSVLFLLEISGQRQIDTKWLPWLNQIWPTQILFGRVSQLFAVNGFYMWRLFCADDWTWSEWL
ncbi:hypothetical protein SNE40_003939 [Patella caerulea]|uniref:Uncharacterized protein n=1 Tax=Patella caerulea TaxID=87958 RepID=A0AAN8K8Y0_PATCE